MSPHRRIEVEIDARYAESVAALLVEHDALGAWTEDDETRAGAAPVTGRALVRASFSPTPGLEARISAALTKFLSQLEPAPEVRLTWSDEELRDWSEAWKERWQPQRIGDRLVVVPSWCSFDAADDDVVLELDPGMAFGTGTHETTRLCAQALEQLSAPGRSLLDVGTGSGILALLAARLGCGPVMAIDNDPDAVAVARQNARANDLEHLLRFAVSADVGVAGHFDLVVANILMKPLLQLSEHICARVAPEGTLLLSGLLVEQLDQVKRAYCARGLLERERRSDGEWGLLLLRR